MIPKVIHYCWFGGKPLSKSAEKCIASWKKYCPDYEIKRWDESNYDINKNLYMKQAYDAKRWGFVPDYARLDIIYNYGGIYLDADVELIKPLDKFLDNKVYLGMEDEKKVNLGSGFGAEAGNYIIKAMRDQYNTLTFKDKLYVKTSSVYQTEILRNYGLKSSEKIQYLDDICTVYPADYFNPKGGIGGKIKLTENTVSIHYYTLTWENGVRKYLTILEFKIYYKLKRVLGTEKAEKLVAWLTKNG